MTRVRALVSPRIFDGESWHTQAAIVIEKGVVRDIVPLNSLTASMQVEEVSDGFLAPGFVDLQVNGGGGVLLNNDPSVDGIRAICATHARFGTTTLLPTLITDTPAARGRVIAAGIEAGRQRVPGFAGLHLEGPHLSSTRKGAHDASLIRPMEDEDLAALIAARKGLPALVTTVAPESVTPEQVRALVDAGVKVSIGHSDAGIERVMELVQAGADMITHLFNAMSQMTGRAPGMVGAALSCGELNVGLIADGFHVHPTSMALAVRAKVGPGRVFLISDAMSSVGTDVTELVLNGRKVKREHGKLTLEDGTLAGADLDMATAVRVIHEQSDVDLGEALRMAALYPAQSMGWTKNGRIGSGYRADIVWLSDALEPNGCWIAGENTR